MDSAELLAEIDSLCALDLAAGHGGSQLALAGPGFRVAELAVSHGLPTGDAGRRTEGVADFHALRDHLSQRLSDRWGRQQPSWGMVTLRVRLDRGEEIPEPWATVSLLVDELDLWRVEGADRWVALGVADGGPADEVRLLGVVTDIDPP
ncbi:hypothetical protein ABZT03_13255 [Streptomyces sp. NPDC005574]|uniref:hypothetical protein n=1 Tax=Streptomyces sp. NPDC005574 TaxID=3156891 RepID=UPI0033BEB3B9